MRNLWNKFTNQFGATIIHPQFIMIYINNKSLEIVKKYCKDKKVIDIGSGNMTYKNILEPLSKTYVCLDHPEISKRYNPYQKPDVIADITKKTPIKNNEFDTAIMLKVLEYIDEPLKAFNEVGRILKTKGSLILTAPFIYPIHDFPYDRSRYTSTQLKYLLESSGFNIKKISAEGNILSSTMLAVNIFLLKRIMDILNSNKTFYSLLYLLFLILITPFIVLISNMVFVSTVNIKLGKYPNYFPIDYLVVATKL
jgi:SAM-dependent methyltransferase